MEETPAFRDALAQGKEHEQSKGFMIGFTITPALTDVHPALKLGVIHGTAI